MEYRLKDVCKIKHGYAFKGKDILKSPTKYILVTPGNFAIGGGFKEDKCKYYNERGEFPKEYILKANDLIVTMTDLSVNSDTLGYGALVPKNKKIYLHNQRIGLIYDIKEDIILKEYLYWFMRTYKYQKAVVASQSGTAIHHTSPERILEIAVDIPEISEQQKVVDILSSIDRKIELNNQINDNLHEIIKNQYSNFMNELTEYQIMKLKDIAVIGSGKRPRVKGNEYEVPLIGASGIMSYTDSDNFKEDIIVIGRVGTLGVVQRYFNKIWASDNTLTIKTEFKNVVENYLKTVDYISLNRGSTQPLITHTDISNLKIKFNKDKFEQFESTVKVIREKIYQNELQNITLEQLRDTLLPKLMNGEINLDSIES